MVAAGVSCPTYQLFPSNLMEESARVMGNSRQGMAVPSYCGSEAGLTGRAVQKWLAERECRRSDRGHHSVLRGARREPPRGNSIWARLLRAALCGLLPTAMWVRRSRTLRPFQHGFLCRQV